MNQHPTLSLLFKDSRGYVRKNEDLKWIRVMHMLMEHPTFGVTTVANGLHVLTLPCKAGKGRNTEFGAGGGEGDGNNAEDENGDGGVTDWKQFCHVYRDAEKSGERKGKRRWLSATLFVKVINSTCEPSRSLCAGRVEGKSFFVFYCKAWDSLVPSAGSGTTSGVGQHVVLDSRAWRGDVGTYGENSFAEFVDVFCRKAVKSTRDAEVVNNLLGSMGREELISVASKVRQVTRDVTWSPVPAAVPVPVSAPSAMAQAPRHESHAQQQAREQEQPQEQQQQAAAVLPDDEDDGCADEVATSVICPGAGSVFESHGAASEQPLGAGTVWSRESSIGAPGYEVPVERTPLLNVGYGLEHGLQGGVGHDGEGLTFGGLDVDDLRGIGGDRGGRANATGLTPPPPDCDIMCDIMREVHGHRVVSNFAQFAQPGQYSALNPNAVTTAPALGDRELSPNQPFSSFGGYGNDFERDSIVGREDSPGYAFGAYGGAARTGDNTGTQSEEGGADIGTRGQGSRNGNPWNGIGEAA